MTTQYAPLDETAALTYWNASPVRAEFFSPGEKLQCQDLADGNVNLVFRISSVADPKKSVILKQALPHARRYPDFKMPLERARIEAGILTKYESLAPGRVPKIFHVDTDLFVNVMEDLNQHHIMRDGILTQRVYPRFAEEIGVFLANVLIGTSDFFLPSDEKKKMMVSFSNPVLCKVTEDLIFTFPFIEHPTNRFPEEIAPLVQKIHSNQSVRAEATRMKHLFMTNAEALLHGDLHTGSLMVNEQDTRVIDPEFGFVGPMAFDIGSLMGNLFLGAFTQAAHDDSGTYAGWLLDTALDIWSHFEENARRLFFESSILEWRSAEFFEGFLKTLQRDSVMMASCEMVRRTIGMAHIPELDAITDREIEVRVCTSILTVAAALLSSGERASLQYAVEMVRSSL